MPPVRFSPDMEGPPGTEVPENPPVYAVNVPMPFLHLLPYTGHNHTHSFFPQPDPVFPIQCPPFPEGMSYGRSGFSSDPPEFPYSECSH